MSIIWRLLFIIFNTCFLVCSCSDNSHEQEMKTNLFRKDTNVTKQETNVTKDFNPQITSMLLETEFISDHNDSGELSLPFPKKQTFEGLRNGSYKEFFTDGNVKEEVIYLHGVQQGSKKIWFANGQVSKMGVMKNDRWHGKYEEWYEDGTPKVIGEYIEGKQHGKWKFFDKEGDALPILQFENGIEMTRKLPSILGN